MKIAIDSDQTGLALKQQIFDYLHSYGKDVVDLAGGHEYPDCANELAIRVASLEYDRGILICGSGLGMAIMANKVPRVYAGVCHDVKSAKRLAASNNAQILCMGCEVVLPSTAKRVALAFIETPFEPRPNAQRMRELENLYL